MSAARERLAGARLALAAVLAGPWVCESAGDTIHLRNGRAIEAERVWEQGNQVLYERDGGTYGVPRTAVARIERRSPQAPSRDPDVRRARGLLAQGDAIAAVRLLVPAVARDPSLAALQALAEAYLKLGDGHSARQALARALALEPRDAHSLALLGDALLVLGDSEGAQAEYRRSLLLHPDSEVERKLSELAPAPARDAGGAQFRLRFDGSVNEPLGAAVLQLLSAAHAELQRRLGGGPTGPITVVLLTAEAFQAQQPPLWAAGVNDGQTIRVPVRGLTAVTPELAAVLRHELAHSFVAARTGGNCPTWLQEGVAQWLEGGPPGRADAALAPLARQGRLLALVSLEAPFQGLSETDAAQAYAQSLSAVAHILSTRGEVGLVRLLAALGDRLPSEEALPVALAVSYPELQREWEAALKSQRGR